MFFSLNGALSCAIVGATFCLDFDVSDIFLAADRDDEAPCCRVARAHEEHVHGALLETSRRAIWEELFISELDDCEMRAHGFHGCGVTYGYFGGDGSSLFRGCGEA